MNKKLAVLLTLGLTACGGGPSARQEFLDATPEAQALQLEITGATEEGVTVNGVWEGDESGTLEQRATAAPDCLVRAREAVKELNDGVRKVLAPIAAVIKDHPDVATGTTHTWPPFDQGNATYRFTMKKKNDTTFGWVLEGKTKGAADSTYIIVMAGAFEKGSQARRGKGVMGVDLDKVASIDNTFKGQGKLLVGFGHANGFKALAYALKGFTLDASVHQPVSAVFYGVRGPNGGTAVRVAAYANLCGTDSAKNEFMLLRVRWLPGIGGRADGLATLGDVPTGRMYVAFSCWDSVFNEGFLLVRDCAKGTYPLQCNATPVKEVGQVANCKPGLNSESLPPEDPNATTPEQSVESGTPDVPTPPGTMPPSD